MAIRNLFRTACLDFRNERWPQDLDDMEVIRMDEKRIPALSYSPSEAPVLS